MYGLHVAFSGSANALRLKNTGAVGTSHEAQNEAVPTPIMESCSDIQLMNGEPLEFVDAFYLCSLISNRRSF